MSAAQDRAKARRDTAMAVKQAAISNACRAYFPELHTLQSEFGEGCGLCRRRCSLCHGIDRERATPKPGSRRSRSDTGGRFALPYARRFTLMVLRPMMLRIGCCCAHARKFTRIVAAGVETRQGLSCNRAESGRTSAVTAQGIRRQMIKNREKDCLAMAHRLALTGDFRDSTDIERELRFKHGRSEAEEVLDDDRIRSALDEVCKQRQK